MRAAAPPASQPLEAHPLSFQGFAPIRRLFHTRLFRRSGFCISSAPLLNFGRAASGDTLCIPIGTVTARLESGMEVLHLRNGNRGARRASRKFLPVCHQGSGILTVTAALALFIGHGLSLPPAAGARSGDPPLPDESPLRSEARDGGSTIAARWTLNGDVSATAPTNSFTSAGAAAPSATADASAILRQETSDPAAKLFMQSCAGCHTVGKGALSGPDLAPTAAWPAADLRAAIERMQRQVGPMDAAQIQGLAELLQDPKARERLAAEEQKSVRAMMARMEKPSVEKGAKLFHGMLAFENGGTACSACHALGGNGGTMGPDLTHIFPKMGETALVSACEQANFKVMSAAYRDHKVTKQEALHLAAYLKAVDAEPPPARATGVPMLGAAGAAACLGAIGYLFRGRHREPLRARLTRRR